MKIVKQTPELLSVRLERPSAVKSVRPGHAVVAPEDVSVPVPDVMQADSPWWADARTIASFLGVPFRPPEPDTAV